MNSMELMPVLRRAIATHHKDVDLELRRIVRILQINYFRQYPDMTVDKLPFCDKQVLLKCLSRIRNLHKVNRDVRRYMKYKKKAFGGKKEYVRS